MAVKKPAPPRAGYSPRSRADKLGLKPGMRVAIVGVDDAAIAADVLERTSDLATGRPRKETAMILYGVEDARGLAKIPALVKSMARDGCLWAIWTKGRKEFKEDTIREFALRHGLVDVKVIAFSETLSALKLVIPLAKR